VRWPALLHPERAQGEFRCGRCCLYGAFVDALRTAVWGLRVNQSGCPFKTCPASVEGLYARGSLSHVESGLWLSIHVADINPPCVADISEVVAAATTLKAQLAVSLGGLQEALPVAEAGSVEAARETGTTSDAALSDRIAAATTALEARLLTVLAAEQEALAAVERASAEVDRTAEPCKPALAEGTVTDATGP